MTHEITPCTVMLYSILLNIFSQEKMKSMSEHPFHTQQQQQSAVSNREVKHNQVQPTEYNRVPFSFS